jgi:Domain of unknown function (DUF1839)
MRYAAIANLDAHAYARHALHGEHCAWVEKNCYVDIWIEIVHTLGLEPTAMLPFTACIDFEGDQWTFFKPSHDELRDLYGIDVQEMNVWRPLIEHAQEHLAAGKLLCLETDAFWLPDAAGTDYRRQHTKTTIALADLDLANRRLGYFHNAGYFALSGEDFARVFRLGVPHDPTYLPLFAELVRTDRIVHRPATELAQMSLDLWHRHLRRRPEVNPISRFKARFDQDLPELQEKGLAHYHAWAFGTTRQLGAAFELAAANLRWLTSQGYDGLQVAAEAFEIISSDSKAFILKGARAVNGRRGIDSSAAFDRMIAAWERGMASLTELFAANRRSD